MAELLYNGHSQSVCLDEVTIVRAGIPHPATKVIIGHTETWTIAATLIGDTSSLLTQVAALELAYASDGHDISLKTAPGGTVLHQMLNSKAADGVHITQRPSFPSIKNAEFVTKRAYTIVAQAEFYDGDPALLVDDQRWSYQIGQDGKTTRTFSGRLETAAGQSAAGYFAAKDPGIPAGYTRGPKTYEKNHDDTELTYNYTDREHWQALPLGVLDGSYTYTVTDSGDSRQLVIAGRFVGPPAAVDAAIATLLQPGRKLLSSNSTTEPFTGARTFTLTYDYSSTSNVREWRESVSFTKSLLRQIYREVLGGAEPERQVGSKTTARASVSGRAVGVNSYPQFPPPLWPESDLVPGGATQTCEGPQRAADGRYEGYTISWRYEYEFSINVQPRLPRVR